MGELTDIDLTGMIEKKGGSTLGKAHEHLAAGVFMRLGFDYMSLDYHGKPYDGVLVGYNKDPKTHNDAKEVFLRTQIKTATRSIPFMGGIRAGVNRTYKSGIKEYKYTREHNDLIVGVDREILDIYLVPTLYVEKFGSSKALSKLQPLKNRWDILLNWRLDFLINLMKELPDFRKK